MSATLHDGTSTVQNASPVPLPVIAIGTWDSNAEGRKECEQSVLVALQAGYRHIDTAALYETEPAVGAAIKRSGVPRKDIVVATKFWNHLHDPAGVTKSLDDSLQRLQLDYGLHISRPGGRPSTAVLTKLVDLYLMHWPVAFKRDENFEKVVDKDGKSVIDHELSENHESTWRAMESLVDSGKARAIGVSNFTIPQLEKLLSYARIKPACNQVECHPYLPQNTLLDFCNKHGITLTCYSPLGTGKTITDQPRIRDDPTVARAAKQLGVDPAQILIAWAVQRGTVPIPKSATPSRIKSNFHVPVLPDDIFKEISEISFADPSKHIRYVTTGQWGMDLFGPKSGQ